LTGASADAPEIADYEGFREAVYRLVEQIPPGRVMAYGVVAATLGSHAPRAIGRIMAHSGGELPWWRVVYSDGHLLPGFETTALGHYAAEGTPLLANGRIDLRRASWRPADSSDTP